ncbi:hypothetical protein [Nitrosopumilus adriaticus]|uniref:Uncharacterized protein n=1 Tax=Nitrosopumilus adriaticus TaxID=1580092 RepID=A0A0D5C1W6_9ARCH|nr:hypothetical protein [Nitrosopumilus adriaticus]AJW70310.1 exported protein of unknown function [Nitrosopumilus adriaticus]
MKTRLLIIFACMFVLLFGYSQHVTAICMENPDWPDAPCYAIRANNPGEMYERNDWVPYYDYKGEEFMESKKTELLEAIKEKRLDEWRREGPDSQHNNVFMYYYTQGEIPHEDGKFYEQHKQEEVTAYYVASLSEGYVPVGSASVHFVLILIPVVALTAFVIWRKRK